MKGKMGIGKRGLSEVVVTVLIVLIAIAAVTTLWLFLKPFFTNTSQGVQTDTLTTSIGIVRNSFTNDNETKILSLDVQKDSGDLNVTAFKVVITDILGKIAVIRYNSSLASLFDSTRIAINYSEYNLSDISTIEIYPLFLIDGREIAGDVPTLFSVLTDTEGNQFVPGSSGGGGGSSGGGGGSSGGGGGSSGGGGGGESSGGTTTQYYWNYMINDSSGNAVFASSNFTLNITG